MSVKILPRRTFIKNVSIFLSMPLLANFIDIDQPVLNVENYLREVLPNNFSAMSIGEHIVSVQKKSSLSGEMNHLFMILGVAENDILSMRKQTFITILREKIQNDFSIGNFSNIGGWILSDTEVGLYKVLFLIR